MYKRAWKDVFIDPNVLKRGNLKRFSFNIKLINNSNYYHFLNFKFDFNSSNNKKIAQDFVVEERVTFQVIIMILRHTMYRIIVE